MTMVNAESESTPQPLSAWSRFFRYLSLVSGWMLVLSVIVLLTNRYLSIARPIPILLAGLVPLLAAPLAFGVLLSAVSRSTILRIATALTAMSYLVIVAPHDAVVGCRHEAADDSISVVASNVLGEGATPEQVADFMQETDADVVALSEAAYWFLNDLGERVQDHYPYQSHQQVENTNGSAIFSQWPLSDVENSVPRQVRAQTAIVDSPYGNFTVIAVHTQAPGNSYGAMRWQMQFEELATFSTDAPTVLAGDFNATEDHKPFRQLLDQGWHDVHDDKGCGPDNTWPTAVPQEPTSSLIPFMRLDHVLVTNHFDTLGVRTHVLPGSDHAAVETQIRFSSNDR